MIDVRGRGMSPNQTVLQWDSVPERPGRRRPGLSVAADSVHLMEGESMQLDLAGVRQALERAREALAGLGEVLYQGRGEELGAVLGQVDALGQACDAARV